MRSLTFKRTLLYFIAFLFGFTQFIYNTYMTPYLTGILGISASFAGVIVGSYGVTQLICRLPLGILADTRQKHRFFIFLGSFLCFVSSLIRVLTQNPYMLLFANTLSGIAISMWISFTILNSMYYKPEELSKSLGTLTAVNNAGILASYILGGLLYERFGMLLLFKLSMYSGILAFLASVFVKDEPTKASNVKVRDLLPVMLQKRLIVFALLAAGLEMLLFATANSFANNVIKEAGVSDTNLSICAALFSLSGVLSSYFVGTKAGQKLGDKRLVMLGFGCLAVYSFLLPFLRGFVPMAIIQFVGGLGSASTFSVLMSCAIAGVPEEKRSTAMGFHQSVYSFGITIGPSIMGALIDALSTRPAFLIAGAFALVLAVTFPVVYTFAIKPAK